MRLPFEATSAQGDEKVIIMRRRWLSTLFVALILALLLPGRALAHPEIVRTEPAADAQLITAPKEVRIVFNEALEAAFSEIQLFNTQGQQVDYGGSALALDEPTTLVLPLPQLTPGLYTVIWRTVGSDGHKIIGNFAFTVQGADVTPTAATATTLAPPQTLPTPAHKDAPVQLPEQPSGPPPWLAALLRAVMLLGAMICTGGWAVLAGVLYPALPADNGPAQTIALRRWRWSAWRGIAILLVGIIGFVLVQTATLADRIDGNNVRAVLFETRLGQALSARLVLALALALVLATTNHLVWWRKALAFVLGGSLLLTFSLAGHAGAQQSPLLPVLADWIHLAATAIWVGGLVTLTLALPQTLGALQTKERISTLAGVIVRFSTFALCSVTALTITGTYGVLLHLTAVSDLWASAYGRALLAKIALFGVLIALGAYNTRIIRPKFVAWVEQTAASALMKQWQKRFQLTVRVEVVLAVIVIGAVGFLTNTAPPSIQARRPATPMAAAPAVTPPSVGMTPRRTRTPVPSKPFAETKNIQDLQVGLAVTPANIGKNRFRVTLRDAAGNPVDVQKVELSIEMLTMDMGVNKVEVSPQGIGTFEAPEGWLSMVGKWKVNVTVRRADADDVETEFMVPVGG